MLFWTLIVILAIQRVSELLIARRNERTVLSEGAVEYDRKGYKVIVAMHAAFFLSFIAEYYLLGKSLNTLWPLLLTIIVLAESLRYWAITSLGKYWNTKILVIPGSQLISKGPYKYIRHPNYLAVVIEIAVIPLIFSCYVTSALFTLLNLIVLRRRIEIEESALTLESQKRNL